MRINYGVVIAVLSAFAVPLSAISAEPDIVIGVPKSQNAIDREPPSPIYEVTPTERPGYIWAPGTWTLQRGRLVWQPGNWIAERPGYTWVPAGWEQRADKWYYAKGYWEANDDGMEEDVAAEDQPPEPIIKHTASNDKQKKKVVAKKRVKKHDYSNTKLWPGYQRN